MASNLKFFIFLISGILLFACTAKPNYKTVDEMQCNKNYKIPIENERDALCYAASLEDIKGNLLNAQKPGSYIDGWFVKILHEGNNWGAFFKSSGQLPSYSCNVIFKDSGEPLKQIVMAKRPIFYGCRYNK